MNQNFYTNKSPNEILNHEHIFSSDWHIFQAFSWYDYLVRTSNFTAISYCALEIRLGIEQLWYEIIVSNVGGKLDIRNYKRCTTQAHTMYKLIEALTPHYEKLVEFTRLSLSVDNSAINIIKWDVKKLVRLHGLISNYLHFKGIPENPNEFNKRFVSAISTLELILDYFKTKMTNSATGIMNPSEMEPEVLLIWNRFKNNEITKEVVSNQLNIILPVLRKRRGL